MDVSPRAVEAASVMARYSNETEDTSPVFGTVGSPGQSVHMDGNADFRSHDAGLQFADDLQETDGLLSDTGSFSWLDLMISEGGDVDGFQGHVPDAEDDTWSIASVQDKKELSAESLAMKPGIPPSFELSEADKNIRDVETHDFLFELSENPFRRLRAVADHYAGRKIPIAWAREPCGDWTKTLWYKPGKSGEKRCLGYYKATPIVLTVGDQEVVHGSYMYEANLGPATQKDAHEAQVPSLRGEQIRIRKFLDRFFQHDGHASGPEICHQIFWTARDSEKRPTAGLTIVEGVMHLLPSVYEEGFAPITIAQLGVLTNEMNSIAQKTIDECGAGSQDQQKLKKLQFKVDYELSLLKAKHTTLVYAPLDAEDVAEANLLFGVDMHSDFKSVRTDDPDINGFAMEPKLFKDLRSAPWVTASGTPSIKTKIMRDIRCPASAWIRRATTDGFGSNLAVHYDNHRHTISEGYDKSNYAGMWAMLSGNHTNICSKAETKREIFTNLFGDGRADEPSENSGLATKYGIWCWQAAANYATFSRGYRFDPVDRYNEDRLARAEEETRKVLPNDSQDEMYQVYQRCNRKAGPIVTEEGVTEGGLAYPPVRCPNIDPQLGLQHMVPVHSTSSNTGGVPCRTKCSLAQTPLWSDGATVRLRNGELGRFFLAETSRANARASDLFRNPAGENATFIATEVCAMLMVARAQNAVLQGIAGNCPVLEPLDNPLEEVIQTPHGSFAKGMCYHHLGCRDTVAMFDRRYKRRAELRVDPRFFKNVASRPLPLPKRARDESPRVAVRESYAVQIGDEGPLFGLTVDDSEFVPHGDGVTADVWNAVGPMPELVTRPARGRGNWYDLLGPGEKPTTIQWS